MKCPHCEASVLDERERDGLTIHVCQKCRDIWLDQIVIERLIARVANDSVAFENWHDTEYDGNGRYERCEVKRDRHDEARFRSRPRRLRGWLESLTEVL